MWYWSKSRTSRISRQNIAPRLRPFKRHDHLGALYNRRHYVSSCIAQITGLISCIFIKAKDIWLNCKQGNESLELHNRGGKRVLELKTQLDKWKFWQNWDFSKSSSNLVYRRKSNTFLYLRKSTRNWDIASKSTKVFIFKTTYKKKHTLRKPLTPLTWNKTKSGLKLDKIEPNRALYDGCRSL